VVLLWPRVIPSAETAALRAVAQPLHQRLFQLIQRALPGRHIDIRPEPQRVCPQAGCEGIAVGVLLLAHGSGCVAVVQVSPPGRSAARQVAWVGDVRLTRDEVAFREPPEQHVLVKDYAACDRLLEDAQAREDQVILAITAATGHAGR
jgi:hypothetical protein